MNWLTELFCKKLAKKSQTSSNDLLVTELDTPLPEYKALPIDQLLETQPLAVLKKFVPLRDFDDIFVANLEQQTLKLPAGSVLFQIGQQRDAIYYLLQGTVGFQPNSITGYEVSETSALANLPLNSGKIQGATAIAKTDVKLLILSENIVSLWTQRSRELYSVQLLDLELPADIADNRFFSHFAQCYRENKLALPSLPQVAIKLNQAMKNDIGIKEVADILQVDAPIATKLIQVANSALYAPDGSITNCQDAIARLGLNTTRNLVMSLSVKELFKCKDAKLMKIMLDAWKSSVFVSSLCFVLAEQCRTINPDDALLAGLVANIGVVPILHFVEQNTEQYHEADKLLTTLSLLAPSVGSLVLHTLGFNEQLADIALHAEDWFYQSEGQQPELIDLVILAKLHSYIGSPRRKELPYINTLPAYAKFKNTELTPELSLMAIQKAQQRIHAIMSLFI